MGDWSAVDIDGGCSGLGKEIGPASPLDVVHGSVVVVRSTMVTKDGSRPYLEKFWLASGSHLAGLH